MFLFRIFFAFFFWNFNHVDLQRKLTVLCISFSWIIFCIFYKRGLIFSCFTYWPNLILSVVCETANDHSLVFLLLNLLNCCNTWCIPGALFSKHSLVEILVMWVLIKQGNPIFRTKFSLNLLFLNRELMIKFKNTSFQCNIQLCLIGIGLLLLFCFLIIFFGMKSASVRFKHSLTSNVLIIITKYYKM